LKLANPVVIGFSLLAFAGAAQAQQSQDTQSQQGQSASTGASSTQSTQGGQSQQSQSERRTSELIGTKVVDKEGKELGQIDEVVLDLQAGKAQAAVLSFGGIMGIGDKQYAFPVSELKPGKQKNQLTIDVTKEKLENAEGFAKGQMPGMDDEYWSRSGQSQQSATGGQQPQGQQQSGGKMNLVRASELEGKEVQDNSGKEAGEIKDVVISLSDGQLKNVVVNLKDAGEARIQATSLSSGTGGKLVLDKSNEELKQQAKQSRQSQSGSQSEGASSGASSGTKQ
jgi:sporulation protein YlmC with PRC-barrel domain